METIEMQIQNNKFKRILTLILAVIMILGCMPFMVMPALAADEEEDAETKKAKEEEARITLFLTTVYPNVDEKLATFGDKVERVNKGTARNPKWEEQHLPTGEPELTDTKNGFALYYHYDTGEVAVKDLNTGQVMFSNPYDVGLTGSASTDDVRKRLMSQIIIQYKDGDKTYWFYSFQHAALYKQIKMKKIRGGIRVEYTIGKEEKRKLVPRMIERSSFETKILQYITKESDKKKMEAYYTLKDANDPTLTQRAKTELQITYKQTKTYAIYVFDPNASQRELTQIENFIKQYTKYTFEDMDEDHALLEYEAVDKAPPLFKLALEYYLEPDGLRVRLPANGLRFDESTYTLSFVNVLPYMGCGRRGNTGYTFIPDGSGALVRYEDIKDTQFTLTNKVYGPDYSFKKVSAGGGHTRKWRLPVFGAVENYTIARPVKAEQEEWYYDENGVKIDEPLKDDEGNPVYYDAEGSSVSSPVKFFVDEEGNVVVDEKGKPYDKKPPDDIEDRYDGFLAIIEDGDAMAEITTVHEGSVHIYNSVSTMFTPRPKDEFQLDVQITGISSVITASSKRKYAGNYIIRYIMLSSDENGSPKKANGFEASYVGMAKAYRKYLEDKGALKRLEESDENIPLFIESLGTIKTSEYVFGMPMVLSTPLTTFDDIKTIIDELNGAGWCDGCKRYVTPDEIKDGLCDRVVKKDGKDEKCGTKVTPAPVTNLKFKLNGWINGGMNGDAPARIRIEKKMGGKNGFRDAVNYASSQNAHLYPDLNFITVWYWRPFDGTYRKKDQVYYMDQLAAREMRYCYICQVVEPFMGVDELIAPERMELMYEKAMKEYDKYNVGSMSVVKLAAELHSNHYRKSLVNRMEAMKYSTDLLERMVYDQGEKNADGSIKNPGGLLSVEANAYAFPYLDSIIKIDLDSSRFMNQSEAIPFYAMVVHGYINIAGNAINMSGDPKYDMLKAIENGASPYFTLTYRNSSRLKETYWTLASYYSVDYNTWKEDMLESYHILNDALKPVKSKPIVNHEFLGSNVVKVTYEGGTSFILNYNHDECIVIQPDGKPMIVECTDSKHEHCADSAIKPLDFVKIS